MRQHCTAGLDWPSVFWQLWLIVHIQCCAPGRSEKLDPSIPEPVSLEKNLLMIVGGLTAIILFFRPVQLNMNDPLG